ncbi:hypothetical protein HDC30_002388 [Pseudomonas sp. JAI115]|uniref:type III secretion system chaperone n=1 Tax=Pseudomonas sp. JAI115 TaxID=2723061 RepID=UPI00160DE155|nr:type III secretion system chaperone [Pseudomonas sp. JAI115]MBB6155165.1 hypothetical protein [Pseudomonas sp. JAI115]
MTCAPTLPSLIDHLGAQLGTSLTLENGVCALYDSHQQQAAVIEGGEYSDSVMLHCRLGALHPEQENLTHLLSLNFDVALLRGCWLALDQGDVRLCAQRELSTLDEQRFCDLVRGFIAQARETRSSLGHLLA